MANVICRQIQTLGTCLFLTRMQNINIIAKRTAVDLTFKLQGRCSQSLPIIVLHGLLGSKRNWDNMSKRLADALNTCVVVADARNHGESPHHESHTYLDLAADVSKLMNTLVCKRATIVGHSMGGRTAMVLALTEPDKIERLVIVDISPVSAVSLQNDFFPNLIEVMKSVNFEGVINVSEARTIAKDKILKSGVIKQIEGMNFLLMNLGKKPDNTVGWVCNLNALKNGFKNIASFPVEMKDKKFYGPTLFIGGEESHFIPFRISSSDTNLGKGLQPHDNILYDPGDLDGIRSYFPNAELKYLPGVGHNVHAEDPDNFFKLVTEFLISK